jgi:uncharacterized membrane protein YoaK (UPF0700 family)
VSNTPTPRRKHLMDLDAPRPVRSASAQRELTRVQQWVLSVLAVTTILHFAAGLVVAAVLLDRSTGARIALCVLAGICGVMAVAAGLLIHRRTPLTPWLALGLVPGVVGVLLVIR